MFPLIMIIFVSCPFKKFLTTSIMVRRIQERNMTEKLAESDRLVDISDIYQLSGGLAVYLSSCLIVYLSSGEFVQLLFSCLVFKLYSCLVFKLSSCLVNCLCVYVLAYVYLFVQLGIYLLCSVRLFRFISVLCCHFVYLFYDVVLSTCSMMFCLSIL